jgi:hypothetical protein
MISSEIILYIIIASIIFIFSFGYVLTEISKIFPKGKRTLFIQYFLNLFKRN